MFRIIFGFILGCAFMLTAMNPQSAKVLMSKTIDTMHESYVDAAKRADLPVPPPATISEVAPTVAAEPAKAPVVDSTPAAPPVPPVPGMK